jgi:hypothetical protein
LRRHDDVWHIAAMSTEAKPKTASKIIDAVCECAVASVGFVLTIAILTVLAIVVALAMGAVGWLFTVKPPGP